MVGTMLLTQDTICFLVNVNYIIVKPAGGIKFASCEVRDARRIQGKNKYNSFAYGSNTLAQSSPVLGEYDFIQYPVECLW